MRAGSLIGSGAGPHSLRRGALLGAAAAANAGVALGFASGNPAAAVFLALLPALLLLLGGLMSGHRAVLVFAALGLTFTGLPLLTEPLPLPGGTAVYATDVILLLAIGAWAADRLVNQQAPGARPAGPLATTWPLLALALFIGLAVLRGHDRYGQGLFGQPLRIVLYAGIAVALVGVDARTMWRGISAVFYAGAVAQFLYALFYMATGGSQTDSLALSTGGTRILALGSAMYLVGSLVCALLNLERSADRFGRQVLHAVIAGLALFGVVVSFGRTSYAAVALIVPMLLVGRRALRRSLLWLIPLLLPVIAAAVLLAPLLDPTLGPTLTSRVGASPATDLNVIWRERARDTALAGIDQHLLTGFGFGRPTRFLLLGRVEDVTGDPHNSYVYLLAGGGMLALGSLLAVMLAYLIDVARRLRTAIGVEQTLLIWSLCTWFAFMVNAFYGPVLSDALFLMTIWILMVLPMCVPVRAGKPS